MKLSDQLLTAMSMAVDGNAPAFYAAAIQWAVSNGHARMTDTELPAKIIEQNKGEIREVMERMKLNVAPKMYSAKADDGLFHMVFADNESDAIRAIIESGGNALKAHDITNNIPREMIRNDQGMVFSTTGWELFRRPSYIGLYNKAENVIFLSESFCRNVKNKEVKGINLYMRAMGWA